MKCGVVDKLGGDLVGTRKAYWPIVVVRSAKLSDNCRAGACATSSWPGLEHCLTHVLDQAGVVRVNTKQEEAPACGDLVAPVAVSLLSFRTGAEVRLHVNQQSACRQVKSV